MTTTTDMPWYREPTRGQWTTFIAAWLGWILDAFDFTVFLLVMPEIAKEFGVTHTATAGAITLTLLMRLIGGVGAGALADRYGRKLPLMLSLLWFAVCDGAVAFAPDFFWVLVFRTLFGFGMGAEWTAGTTLAMENWPARSRGIASGILQGSWAIGYLLAAVVSAAVVPVWGWRALFIIAAVPALLILPIRIWVPESEEWKRQQVTAAAQFERKKPRVSGQMGALVFGSILLAAAFSAYYGLTGMYPTMLKVELGLVDGGVAKVIALFNVGMMIGAIACGTLASKRGIPTALFVFALGSIPVLPLYVGQVPGALEFGAFMAGALGGGYSGVTPLLLTGLFPAEVRARCVGIVYHVGAFGAAFVPMGTAALSASMGWSLGLTIAGVVATFQVLMVLVLLLRPRSMKGLARRDDPEEGAAAAHA